MHRLAILTLVALLLPASAEARKKKKDADVEPTEAATPAATPQIPDDKNSAKFVDALLSMEITRFSPIDSASGAKFVYTALAFSPDNTWSAEGYVEVMDERMECAEGGTWSMEPAESATIATMTWTLGSTDCINQEVGAERRYRVILDGERLSVEYR